MPIYEYRCKKCGEKFERFLSLNHDRKTVKCPKCGESEPERVFSPFSTDNSEDSDCSLHSFG